MGWFVVWFPARYLSASSEQWYFTVIIMVVALGFVGFPVENGGPRGVVSESAALTGYSFTGSPGGRFERGQDDGINEGNGGPAGLIGKHLRLHADSLPRTLRHLHFISPQAARSAGT